MYLFHLLEFKISLSIINQVPIFLHTHTFNGISPYMSYVLGQGSDLNGHSTTSN